MDINELIKSIDDGTLKLSHMIGKDSVEMTIEQKSQYIESIIIRAPLTSFIILNEGYTYTIIDGLQRIKLLNDFFKNRFVLTGMKFLHEFNGKGYSDLARPFQRRIEETYINMDYIESISDPVIAYRVALSYL